MVLPLNWIGDAIQSVGNAIGNGFDYIKNLEITQNFLNVISEIGAVATTIGSKLTDLGAEIGGFFTTLGNTLWGWLSDLVDGIGNVLTYIGDILNYINPLSDKFFLKIAFVPDQQFMTDYQSNFKGMLDTKFAFFMQLKDTMTAFGTAIQSGVTTWQGLTIDLSNYGMGSYDIIDPTAIQSYGEKMKFWIGGLLYFITGMFLVRKLSGLLGEGR